VPRRKKKGDIEKAGDLCEELFGLTQARADEQDQTGIVQRGVKRHGGCRRRLARLPAAIEQDPWRARAEESCLPRVGLKSEPILHKRDRIKRMREIESKINRHARSQREALR
jgi:hypothetical protein